MDWIMKIEKLLFLFNRLRGFSTPCPFHSIAFPGPHATRACQSDLGHSQFTSHRLRIFQTSSEVRFQTLGRNFFLSKQLFSPFSLSFHLRSWSLLFWSHTADFEVRGNFKVSLFIAFSVFDSCPAVRSRGSVLMSVWMMTIEPAKRERKKEG